MAEQIYKDLLSLTPASKVTLFQLDMRRYPGGDIVYLHPHRQTEPIWFDGIEYKPLPMEVEGYEQQGSEAQAGLRLTVADVDGLISTLCYLNNDLLLCSLTRVVTLKRFLDAANFPNEGFTNPDANPNERMRPDVYHIERKVNEVAGEFVEFELKSALDLANQTLPRRRIIANSCQWLVIGGYRGPYCGYNGTRYFDIDNNPVTSPDQDVCSGTPTGCNIRNFDDPRGLPYGSIPGASLIRSYT